MTASRSVIGFHGTNDALASAMQAGTFTPPAVQEGKWLGPGLYFFEEHPKLAEAYAKRAVKDHGGKPVVIVAEIDISRCLNLFHPAYQAWVRMAYLQHISTGTPPTSQKPFELLNGVVRSGVRGPFRRGRNVLDHKVIDTAIDVAKQMGDEDLNTVRAGFIELGPLFPTSWLFEGMNITTVVRNPPDAMTIVDVIDVF